MPGSKRRQGGGSGSSTTGGASSATWVVLVNTPQAGSAVRGLGFVVIDSEAEDRSLVCRRSGRSLGMVKQEGEVVYQRIVGECFSAKSQGF